MSNILPVTSNQDFFGISIVEAVAFGNIPILPNRLSYPELFEYKENQNLFYENELELKKKLIDTINNISNLKDEINNLGNYAYNKFSWNTIAKLYDRKFETLLFN